MKKTYSNVLPRVLAAPGTPMPTRAEIIVKITANHWWPFDKVDPKILDEVARRQKRSDLDAAPEALF